MLAGHRGLRRLGTNSIVADLETLNPGFTFVSMSTRRPKDIARSAASAFANRKRGGDAFRRETFALPREAAREKAREPVSPLSQDGLYDRDRIVAGIAR